MIQYVVALFSFDTAGFKGENGSGNVPLAQRLHAVTTKLCTAWYDEDWVAFAEGVACKEEEGVPTLTCSATANAPAAIDVYPPFTASLHILARIC